MFTLAKIGATSITPQNTVSVKAAPPIPTTPAGGTLPNNLLQGLEKAGQAFRPYIAARPSPVGVSTSPIGSDVAKLSHDIKKQHDLDELHLADSMVYNAARIVHEGEYGYPLPGATEMALAKVEMAEASQIRRSVANSGVSPDMQEEILAGDFLEQQGFSDWTSLSPDGPDEMMQGYLALTQVESEIQNS